MALEDDIYSMMSLSIGYYAVLSMVKYKNMHIIADQFLRVEIRLGMLVVWMWRWCQNGADILNIGGKIDQNSISVWIWMWRLIYVHW